MSARHFADPVARPVLALPVRGGRGLLLVADLRGPGEPRAGQGQAVETAAEAEAARLDGRGGGGGRRRGGGLRGGQRGARGLRGVLRRAARCTCEY